MPIRRILALSAASVALLLGASASAEPTFAGFVESETLPVRVYYVDGIPEATIDRVLSLAEQTWQQQVVEMGFTPPTALDEKGGRVSGLWIHLDPNAPYDTAAMDGDNPDTPWTDCTVHVQLATLSSSSYLDMLVPHESNHALEMADDCGESNFAFEQTTVAVTTLLDPSDTLFSSYFLPAFQLEPQHGLACTFFYSQDLAYYHYGSSLFQVFLEERYGNEDGKLLAQAWKAARQDGTVENIGPMGPVMSVQNDPDLLDALGTVLAPVTLAEAYSEFAQWRYFVGDRDDGTHFKHGSQWKGGEVTVAAQHGLETLPLVDAEGPVQVDELGSVYLEFPVSDLPDDRGLQLSFHGAPESAWSVAALLVPLDGAAESRLLDVDDQGAAELDLEELDGVERVVLVVSSLGDGDFDGESPSCSSGYAFSYGAETIDVGIPPTIDGVDPGEVTVGTTEYLWVTGTGFASGATVAVEGGGATVDSVDFIDEGTLGVEVDVASEAVPGARDVIVTHPNGKTATLSGGLRLLDAETGADAGVDAAPQPSEDAGSDGGCSMSGQGSVGTAWAGLLAGLLALAVSSLRGIRRS